MGTYAYFEKKRSYSTAPSGYDTCISVLVRLDSGVRTSWLKGLVYLLT